MCVCAFVSLRVCVCVCDCVYVCVHACQCLGSITRRKEDENGGTGKLLTCFLGILEPGFSDFYVVNHGMIKGEQSGPDH